MSHSVKRRGVNWSKAGKENILGQEAEKEVKTAERENGAGGQRHFTPLTSQ